MYSKKLLVLLGVVGFLITSLGLLIYFADNLNINRIQRNFFKLLNGQKAAFTYEIHNQIDDQEYNIDDKVFRYSQVAEKIKDTPILDIKHNIYLTSNSEKIQQSFIEPDGTLASGFWFEIGEKEINMHIYINPVLNSQQKIFYLHTVFLLCELYVIEDWKLLNWSDQNTYIPDYDSLKTDSFDIAMDTIRNNDYFFIGKDAI